MFSGAGALAVALYAVVLERVFRESPGWTWMWVRRRCFLVNSLSYGPLMNIFKASKEGEVRDAARVFFRCIVSRGSVDCVVSTTGRSRLVVLGGDAFWYFSIAKLWESTDFV